MEVMPVLTIGTTDVMVRREETGGFSAPMLNFDGFIVEDQAGQHHRYRSREKPLLTVVERAWLERQHITVISEPGRAGIPRSIMLTLGVCHDQRRCCEACRCEGICHCTAQARCCPECTCS
jgi:hypothetical protein